MKQQKQQQKLGALIRDLERELSEGKTQAAALEDTHKRLQEAEHICQELADENRRLEKEITAWQERFSVNEETQKQRSLLEQQFNALQTEHARVSERNRQLEEEFAKRDEAAKATVAGEDAKIVRSGKDAIVVVAPEFVQLEETAGPAPSAGDGQAMEAEESQVAWGWFVRNWQFGAAFLGVILLTIVGAVAVKNLQGNAPLPKDPRSNPEVSTVDAVAEPTVSPPSAKSTRVRGAFQTIRPTQVFSQPTEDSVLIATIVKGTKVNVVDASDGWLEIHSKHGRPPGFIRQDTAVKTGSNGHPR